MLTNCSSVRVVKSAMVIVDRFAPLVAAGTMSDASHKPAIKAPIVIRSNLAPANKPVRSHSDLFLTDVFVALFPPRVRGDHWGALVILISRLACCFGSLTIGCINVCPIPETTSRFTTIPPQGCHRSLINLFTSATSFSEVEAIAILYSANLICQPFSH